MIIKLGAILCNGWHEATGIEYFRRLGRELCSGVIGSACIMAVGAPVTASKSLLYGIAALHYCDIPEPRSIMQRYFAVTVIAACLLACVVPESCLRTVPEST